ncbi:MAG TPA: DUF2382 domain-containing protein [Coleofasciculaceae cyanobacterium]|jgi:hypothetical protein
MTLSDNSDRSMARGAKPDRSSYSASSQANSGYASDSNSNTRLSELDRELISYQIIDSQGIPRATVADLYYAADNSLNLLIKLDRSTDLDRLSLKRLASSDIRQIDRANKLILSSLSYQQLENLPLYQALPTHLQEAVAESSSDDYEMNPTHNQNLTPSSQIERITLLEEKLQVKRRKQKVGEVVVRRQVETRMVQLPLRRETLIVERIGNNPERLTEVVISENQVNGFKYDELSDRAQLNASRSNYLNLQTAQELLEAIAHLDSANNAKVRVEIVTDSSEARIQHQNICDRYL